MPWTTARIRICQVSTCRHGVRVVIANLRGDRRGSREATDYRDRAITAILFEICLIALRNAANIWNNTLTSPGDRAYERFCGGDSRQSSGRLSGDPVRECRLRATIQVPRPTSALYDQKSNGSARPRSRAEIRQTEQHRMTSMFKNLAPNSMGLFCSQSELIELTLTHGFRGLHVDFEASTSKSTSKGIDHAIRFIKSAPVKITSTELPIEWFGDDASFESELARLSQGARDDPAVAMPSAGNQRHAGL